MNSKLVSYAITAVLMSIVGCQSAKQREAARSTVRPFSRAVALLPKGDPAAGQRAFADLRCHACHRVASGHFPEPVATPDVPVVIGPRQASFPQARLIESIVAPSHTVPNHLPTVRSGSLSRMGDYTDVMSVRQLIDLVAFVQSLSENIDSSPQESQERA